MWDLFCPYLFWVDCCLSSFQKLNCDVITRWGGGNKSHTKRENEFCFVLLENTKSRDRRVKSTTAHLKLRGHDTRRNEEKRKTRKVCFFSFSFYNTPTGQKAAVEF